MKTCGATFCWFLIKWKGTPSEHLYNVEKYTVHTFFLVLIHQVVPTHCGFLPLQMLNKTAARSSSCSEGLPCLDPWTLMAKHAASHGQLVTLTCLGMGFTLVDS